jgi:hypothetical protein
MKAPSDTRIYTLDKLDIAARHVDWAIKLLLDHDDPAAALTLAGAADDAVGGRLGERAASRQLSAVLAKISGLKPQEVANEHLNKARNWMKHAGKPFTLEAPLEMDAVTMIIRALSNFAEADSSLPSDGPRFLTWLKAGRPDLFA